MQRIQPTPQQQAVIDEVMAAPYPATIGTLAGKLGLSDCDAARLLPESAAAFVPGDASARFAEVWEALAEWEKVTLFIIHAGSVFEIEGRLSKGKIGHGYYNILSKHAALAVQFFSKSGSVAFAVFAGREDHRIIPSVREAFFAAKARFAADAG